MERALIIGASGGIGGALTAALEARGTRVTALSRSGSGLDVTDAGSVQRAFAALAPPFDLVLVASGILAPAGEGPEKTLAAVTPQAMAQVFAVNAIGPALVLAQVPRLLPKDRPAAVAVLTARVGSIGDNQMGGWYSYRASKAAANQITRGAAIELGRKFPQATVVALHPGTVATPFSANYPAHKKRPADAAAQSLLEVLARLTPADSGRFFDWRGQEVPW